MTEQSWDLLRTVEMIWDLYGRSQEALAHSRFNSALRRWDYAMVHLEELERTLHLTNDTFGKYPFSEQGVYLKCGSNCAEPGIPIKVLLL